MFASGSRRGSASVAQITGNNKHFNVLVLFVTPELRYMETGGSRPYLREAVVYDAGNIVKYHNGRALFLSWILIFLRGIILRSKNDKVCVGFMLHLMTYLNSGFPVYYTYPVLKIEKRI